MSTTISESEVARIAALARLHLSEEEMSAAAKQLAGVMAHFAAIQAVDTTDVPTTDNIAGLTNISRADVAVPDAICAAADLLAAAPAVQDNQFKVKAVFAE